MDNSIKAERTTPVLYLVVPCYNEEEVIERSAQVLGGKLRRLQQAGRIAPGSKVMFVNDGSRDDTLRLLHEAAAADPLFSVVSLSGNYGHQSAILAGMMTARQYADAVVTIDADLQQDIEALDKFLDSYMAGSEVVYGVRNDRHSDGFFKKGTATMYYNLMQPRDHKPCGLQADVQKGAGCAGGVQGDEPFPAGADPDDGISFRCGVF